MYEMRYVWKLLYAYMLGYEIDFGHFQVGNLEIKKFWKE